VIRKEVLWQLHGSGVLVPPCGGASAPAVLIPLQADLLNQKYRQIFGPTAILLHRRTSSVPSSVKQLACSSRSISNGMAVSSQKSPLTQPVDMPTWVLANRST